MIYTNNWTNHTKKNIFFVWVLSTYLSVLDTFAELLCNTTYCKKNLYTTLFAKKNKKS